MNPGKLFDTYLPHHKLERCLLGLNLIFFSYVCEIIVTDYEKAERQGDKATGAHLWVHTDGETPLPHAEGNAESVCGWSTEVLQSR